MQIFDETNIEWWLGLPEEERHRVEMMAQRIDLVYEYLKQGNHLSPEDVKEIVSEVIGERSEKWLKRMRKAVGAFKTKRYAEEIQVEATKKRRRRGKAMVGNGTMETVDFEPEQMMCAEAVAMYMRSDGGFMRELVTRLTVKEDYTLLAVLDIVLKDFQDEWDGYKALRREIENLLMLQVTTRSKKPQITREQFREALLRLFKIKDYHDKPLFKRANHWVAVMRVAIDFNLVGDNAFEAFVGFIRDMQLPIMPKKLTRQTVSNSYNGIYTKPLTEWTDDNYQRWYEGGCGQRKVYYDEMRAVAEKLHDLLN